MKFQIEVNHHHHYDARLGVIAELCRDNMEHLMAVSAEVQRVLDLVRSNTSIVASVDLGITAMRKQIEDLKAQIASVSLSADDKQALTSAADELTASVDQLQRDIPASTAVDPNAPQSSQVPAQAEPQPAGVPGMNSQAEAERQAVAAKNLSDAQQKASDPTLQAQQDKDPVSLATGRKTDNPNNPSSPNPVLSDREEASITLNQGLDQQAPVVANPADEPKDQRDVSGGVGTEGPNH